MEISASATPQILFICMGNICRSPTAEAVFRKLAGESPLAGKMHIDSAGTIGAHAGAKPDPRAIEIGNLRGYQLEKLRARQVTTADFSRFDLVIAMDLQNVQHLKAICPPAEMHKIILLMSFAPDAGSVEVPDPYYGGAADFEHALSLIERGCRGLLRRITHPHVAPPKPPRKRAA
jgi:protein-tyrosine phosphatase